MKKNLLIILLIIGLLLIGVKSYAGLQEVEQALKGVEGWTEEKLFIDSTLIANKDKVNKLKKLKNLSLKRKGEYEKKANETISDLDKKTYVIIKNVYEYLAFKIEEVLKNPNGTLAGGGSAVNNPTGKCSLTNPCKEGDFCRIKTGQCFPLVHKDRGFKPFKMSGKIIKASCNTGDVQSKINSAGKGDTVLMPACTMNGVIKITNNYVALRGSGMGKTKLIGSIRISGHHIIISDLTINADGYSGGVDGYHNTGGYLLYERIEVFNGGEAGGVKITHYPYNTVRYCKLSNSLHGIDNKIANKSQIYSNIAFNNSNYGYDGSTTTQVEIAGNYFYNNTEAGCKTPSAGILHYHHNDMNNNGKAGIVYYRDNGVDQEFGPHERMAGELIVEYNDLTGNNYGFNGTWAENERTQMKYLILRYNKMTKWSCKKCGRIEIWGDNGKSDFGFGMDGQTVIKHK